MLSMANKITDAVYIDYQKNYLCIKPVSKMVTHLEGYSFIKEREVKYSRLE